MKNDKGAFDGRDKRIEELEKALILAREALEIIAGHKQCFDNTLSNVEMAKRALAGDNDEQLILNSNVDY